MAPASRTISVSNAGNSQQGNPSPIKSNNKPKDHNSKNLALRPQGDENLSAYKDSEAPPEDNDIVASSKTESSPMDTAKLQRLLNEQSFIREKSSASNAGLQTLKDSSLPQDCPELGFTANLEKLSQLSATKATHSLSSDSFESSSLTAIEELSMLFLKNKSLRPTLTIKFILALMPRYSVIACQVRKTPNRFLSCSKIRLEKALGKQRTRKKENINHVNLIVLLGLPLQTKWNINSSQIPTKKHFSTNRFSFSWKTFIQYLFLFGFKSGCRTVLNNGSGSGLAPAQNILAVQVWFGFT